MSSCTVCAKPAATGKVVCGECWRSRRWISVGAGCNYCKPQGDTLLEPGGPHDFRIQDGAIYYYDEQRGWEGEEINFCPWCGRPLKEERYEAD